jgi:hypothetical protein
MGRVEQAGIWVSIEDEGISEKTWFVVEEGSIHTRYKIEGYPRKRE